MNPYRMLGVLPGSGDKKIRQAYLDAIKNASPDSNPKRFAALSRAYEQIKDERSRNMYLLFNRECPGESPLDALVLCSRPLGPPRPLAMDAFRKFLQKCAE